MLKKNFTYSGVPGVLLLSQLFAILFYLNANIVNVGDAGIALPVLASYVALSALIFFILSLQKVFFIRLHFIVFLIFLAWIAMRAVIDMGDLKQLKAITIGTTGGIFLFYIVGAAFSISYAYLLGGRISSSVPGFVVIFFGLLLIYLFGTLFERIREDLFLISKLDGAYQRPGNYLSISFIMVSAILLATVAKFRTSKKKIALLSFWITIYSLMTVVALVSAQLFGSNSATAVVSGISVLTVTSLLLMSNGRLYQLHADGLLALPLSKQVARGLVSFGIIGMVTLIFLLSLLMQVTNIDITRIRLLGFGSDTITSLNSRIEILFQTGMDQLGYAPLLGNMNVTYLTTGDAGRTLHSFFPFIWSNYGLLGLFISFVLFLMIFRQVYKYTKIESRSCGSLSRALISFYFFLILLFILFFANLTVGVTWPVMWFTVGFISQPFGFKSRLKT